MYMNHATTLDFFCLFMLYSAIGVATREKLSPQSHDDKQPLWPKEPKMISKNKQKTHHLDLRVIAAIIAIIGIGLWLSHDHSKPSVSHKSVQTESVPVDYENLTLTQGEREFILPSPRPLGINLQRRPAGPWPNQQSLDQTLRQAMDLILSLTGSRQLQTDDDRAIITRIERLRRGEPMNLVLGPFEGSVMGYNCLVNQLAISNYTLEVPWFAKTLYHEMLHAVDCEREMERDGLTNREQLTPFVHTTDVCDMEAPATAAEVRFLVAMVEANKHINVISTRSPKSDDLTQLLNKWDKLADGSYCSYLKEVYERQGL